MVKSKPNRPEVIVYKEIEFRRYPDANNWADRMYYVPNHQHRKRGIGRLHQEVWKDANGPIPDGCEIHHRDGNALNNALENLECLTKVGHNAYHASQYTEAERERRRVWFNRIREAASNWHRSEAGKAWHSHLSKLSWEKRVSSTHVCEYCDKEYQSRAAHDTLRYCSSRCRSAARRRSGTDNVSRSCGRCGKTFNANKYSKQRFCSRSCGIKHARAERRNQG